MSDDDTQRDPVTWRDLHLWQIQPVRDVLLVLAVYGLLYLGYVLSTVTVPMLLALLLAYLVEPLVRLLTSKVTWVSRKVAAGGIILAIALVVVVPLVAGLTFGLMQGVSAVNGVTSNVVRLQQSIDNPEDAELREALPSDTWRRARDYLVGLDAPEQDESATDAIDADAGGGPAAGPGDAEVSVSQAGTSTEAITLTTSQKFGRQAIRGLRDWLDANLGSIGQRIGGEALEAGAWVIRAIGNLTVSLGLFGFGAFLTLFFFFFFSTGLGEVGRFFRKLIPREHRARTLELAGKMDAVIAGFIRGRLIIMVILSVEFIVAYWLIGVPAPLLLGIVVGVLSAVPYLSLVGIPVSIVLMLLEPSGVAWQNAWWWVLGAPVATYFLVQATDDYIWTPKIQGKATDMDTPTILFAVLAGGALAGIYGVLVAIPVAACLKILVREVLWPKVTAWIEGRAKDPLPIKD